MTTDRQLEIEAKIAVDDLDAIEDRLIRLQARRIGRYVETDTFFDDPDRRLQRNQSALRLRVRNNRDTDQSNYRLTFKGPIQPGLFKQRREIECAVDTPQNVRDLLEMLGYLPFARYTKHRNSWAIADCVVEVDELNGIGKFIEVEGPDETAIRAVLDQLSLADQPVIHESYLALVLRKKKDKSI